jgi:hypothetical protein
MAVNKKQLFTVVVDADLLTIQVGTDTLVDLLREAGVKLIMNTVEKDGKEI